MGSSSSQLDGDEGAMDSFSEVDLYDDESPDGFAGRKDLLEEAIVSRMMEALIDVRRPRVLATRFPRRSFPR